MNTNNEYKELYIIAHNAIVDIKKLYLKKPSIPFNREKEKYIKIISVKKIKGIIDLYFKKIQKT